VEAQAIEATERALREGDEAAARNASTAGGIAADKALNLDRAILAAQAEHDAERVRLREGALALQAEVLRLVFEAIDVPPPTASMRVLLAQAGAGEALQVPDELAAEERERARLRVRGEYLDELLAEGWMPPGEEEDREDERPGEQDEGEHEESGGEEQDGDPEAVEGQEEPQRLRLRDRRAIEQGGEPPGRLRPMPTRPPRFARGMFDGPGSR
jgi:hypothetical protein